jgi:hypothetical protein
MDLGAADLEIAVALSRAPPLLTSDARVTVFTMVAIEGNGGRRGALA